MLPLPGPRMQVLTFNTLLVTTLLRIALRLPAGVEAYASNVGSIVTNTQVQPRFLL